MNVTVTEGAPEPLGVTPDADGINVAVFSAHATAIQLCLFDDAGARELARITLPERSGDIWHGHVAGVPPGARYGFRAHGPFAPLDGHRFNPNKLLLDPYAVAIDRPFRLHPTMFGYRRDRADDLSFDETDSAPAMPKAIVLAPDASLRAAVPLVPWPRTILYELHVRGFSRLHPHIPAAVRGTFAALADPAAVAYLTSLGVTSVEIMPPAAWVDERHLAALGLRNYWGYNPVGWMAPDPTLAPGGWAEVRAAVAALAAAGIETIVDVVFNHSGEGDELGPTLSLRGLDNASYYRLADDRRFYANNTGTGHELATERPAVLRLVTDALRAWARRGGVHGFRFDLATTLGRRAGGFDRAAPLLAAIEQDPELRALKMIAEPWDIGPGGYQAGGFPPGWGEWNDQFRDTARKFWRGDGGVLGDLATRLAGSGDLFGAKRRPSRSINFVVAHDGFSLADLVSYEHKHNEANGEQNRDGTDANHSWNNGAEGPTDDAGIRAARLRDQRALLATLLLSRGTPMLAMGSELGHSQGGNNNAYAQDNSASWLDWAAAEPTLQAFVAGLASLRQAHPALHADRFLTGAAADATLLPDVAWRRADGHPMEPADWQNPGTALLVAVLYAEGDRLALVFNRGAAAKVTLPAPRDGFCWRLEIDSTVDTPPTLLDGTTTTCPPRAVLALAEVADTGAGAARGRRTGVDPDLLDRLATAAGIAPEWFEIDGTRHQVSVASKQAILAAMQLPAQHSAEARDSLSRFADTHQRRALPHALVVREGESAEVPFVPDPDGAGRASWLVLEDEDGAQTHVRLGPGHTGGRALAADGFDSEIWRTALPTLPVGRWRMWHEARPDLHCALTVAPQTCYLPEALASGARRFGVAGHLYSLRRPGDQGIGDFSTLAELGRAAARMGAASVGLNPLHALFPQTRERASPYHPSDRRFLDPIYVDLDGEGFGLDAPAARALLDASDSEIEALAAAPLVDYPRVWALKRAVLEAAFSAFDEPTTASGFEAFQAYGGAALERFAAFQAISEARGGEEWRRWPAELRDADHAGVAAFARAHRPRVRFHTWLQFLADQQFAAAADGAREAGLSLGFYRDLAIGTAPDGAEAWASARELAAGISIGAPPDPFSASGQIWNLPPPDPWRLRESGFRGFAGMLGANMRHAGALRIDHAMGFARLFWVPDGASGAEGAYVAYPLADMLGELALESARARCFVVGEDLGTVPEGFRDSLSRANVLSYRVLWFERDAAGFIPPARYPARAVACVSTHDLPTLAGWREGADIAERTRLGLLDAGQAQAAAAERRTEVLALASALGGPADAPAVHGFLAASPCALVMAQADDLAGETVALNLPGTDRERPNWRRKVSVPLPDLVESPRARAILGRMAPGRVA
jgi:glycogen debranching enzyme GlgX/4-alpha-glucanotransferase